MKRRVTVTGKANKKRRGKTPSPKPKTVSVVARHRVASDADLKEQLDQRTCELAEARRLLAEAFEQQTATSEILGVISGSPTDVQPTLDAIVKTAVSLCDSYDAVILLREGDYLRMIVNVFIGCDGDLTAFNRLKLDPLRIQLPLNLFPCVPSR
jgi:hypothetical protein